jgi:poly-gamma-glutamate capsule biosynthesis protein CapA/YwtB (metallophosphatase superfamily)
VLDGAVTLFLGGDVMLGRGIDQILPHPGDPTLWERSVRDARTYVELAEAVNGPIPWPVDYSWPWGDALAILDRFRPDVRLVNLETSVTRSDHFDPGKGIHYRMSPDNLPALTAARLDVCSLANNHVLDFGISGLEETLDVMSRARIRGAGAGRNATEAAEPVMVPGDGGRVVVFSFGTTSSGVPGSWAATADRPGICLLPDLSYETATASSSRCIGDPTGGTRSRPGRSASLTDWSTAVSIWCMDTPHTIRSPSRSIGTGSCSLAAAT